MHTPSLHLYVERLDAGDLQGVADLMLDSAQRLARGGEEFLICPDNTIHQAFHLVQPRSPLPWLHIAEVVAAAAAERGWSRLGILGTRWLVDSEVYPEKLELSYALDGYEPLTVTAQGLEGAVSVSHPLTKKPDEPVNRPPPTKTKSPKNPKTTKQPSDPDGFKDDPY